MTDLRHIYATSRPMVEPMVNAVRPGLLPVEPLPIVNRINDWRIGRFLHRFGDECRPDLIVVGKPSRLAETFIQRFPDVYAVYDAMDDFPEFMRGLARRNLRLVENEVARQADLVVTSCESIHEKFAGCSRTALVHNACDTSAIAPAGAARPGRLGYVGTIGGWFDWEIVIHIAEECPDLEIELVGPVFGAKPSRLPANVALVGSLPHQEAMRRLSGYAAGLIPFRINPLTESVDPVKYYEYRAAGLPVISTAFGTMCSRGEHDHVYHIGRDANARAVVEQAVRTPVTDEATAAFRRDNDWSVRWAPLAELLGQDTDAALTYRSKEQ
ncbi:MAG TPA: glycosyl transferase [Gammaproteobacteria bacterium]|nr:glycosyl transferase [Gammaproteobacteria bacterium]